MFENLRYLPETQDRYSSLSQEKLWKKLKEAAKVIYNGYQDGITQAFFLRRWFEKIIGRVQRVQNVYNRIFFFSMPYLPEDLMEKIFGFLDLKEIKKFNQVHRQFIPVIQKLEFHRA